MISCIFLDIDGTLLDHDIGIQESTKKAIYLAKKHGHKVCIATGRSKPEVDNEVRSLPFDAFIYSCGCLVETPSSTLFYEPLSTQDVNSLIDLLQRYQVGFNLEGVHTSYLDKRGYAFFQNIFEKNHEQNSELARQFMASIRMLPLNQLKEEDKNQIVKLATFAPDMASCERVQEQLPNHLKFLIHGKENDSLINGEILPSHISKATGIDYLCEYFHIPLIHCVAIGDSLNDLEMITHCGTGVAMGNAVEELKQASDFTTTSSKEDGIYQAFKTLNLI